MAFNSRSSAFDRAALSQAWRILQINKFALPHIGGIEKYLHLLTSQLARESRWKLRVLVCSNNLTTRLDRTEGYDIMRVASLGTVLSMPIAPTFPYWLRKEEADIIHFHHPFPLGELSSLLLKKSCKIVVTWHSDIIGKDWFLRLFKAQNQRFMERVDRILVTSPNYLEFSRALRPYRAKCRIVPLGIDTSEFRRTSETMQDTDRIRSRLGSPLLLFVGRLVAYKGLSYLLEAMTDLPAVRLAIIGDGPEKPALSQFIRAKQLQERIHFFPNITDDQLPAYYHACDAFVLPSSQVNETFGLVQLEAMTAGKPVISTRLPTGVPYVNEDGKSGLVVEPRSSAALKNAIQRLLADPVMAQEFGQYGSERAQQLFDIRRSAELVAECYRELTS